MSVKMKPTSTIIVELGLDPDGEGMKWLTNTVAEHMDKYVPYDTGNLSDYRIEDNNIVYNQLYAEYQWRGMREDGTHVINPDNRNRDHHPLATSHWDEAMKTAEMDDIVKEFQEYINHH